MNHDYDPPLDAGIARIVEVLRLARVNTFESCDGSPGHSFCEPTVRFHGGVVEGFRALDVAIRAGFPVAKLRRYWHILEGAPAGPWWELTFTSASPG